MNPPQTVQELQIDGSRKQNEPTEWLSCCRSVREGGKATPLARCGLGRCRRDGAQGPEGRGTEARPTPDAYDAAPSLGVEFSGGNAEMVCDLSSLRCGDFRIGLEERLGRWAISP